MSTIPVQRLNEQARDGVVAHFLSLSAEDRRLRFGSSLSAEGIASYVDRIDFERDAAFAVHDDSLLIVGIAHVALSDDHAELGLSVLPAHRGRGVGSALFERGAQHARNRFVRTLFMHCLRENAAIVHIAQRFGMQIVTESGDADAHLELLPGFRRLDRRRARGRPGRAVRLRAQSRGRGVEGRQFGAGGSRRHTR